MRIDYIKLTNFRQYKDERIVFGVPKDTQNFTIIQGANGCGKTNLVNAITWCLYGEELHLGKKYEGLPIYNMIALQEAKMGGNLPVEVEIQMIEESGKKILFKRSSLFRKTDSFRCLPFGDSRLTMMRLVGKEWIPVDDPAYVVSRLIPKSLERYFFFDGERLDDYFREATGKEIRGAVFNVSQLGILERVIEHLNNLKRDYLSRSKDLSPNETALREQLEQHQQTLSKLAEEIERLENEKEEAGKCEEEYNEKLRTNPLLDIDKLATQRDTMRIALQTLDTQAEEMEKEKLDFLMQFYPLTILNKPLLKIRELISERTESGEIPPDFKRNFLKKMLQKKKCICGTDLSKKDESRKRIEGLLAECDAISDISEELMVIDANASSLLETSQDFRPKQIGFRNSIKELQERRTSLNSQINEIDAELGGSNVDQVRFWESKRREWRAIRDERIEEIGKKQVEAEGIRTRMKETQGDLDKELQAQSRHKELVRILSFYDNGLNAATKIKDEIMEDVRREVEEKTNEEFHALIWKKKEYKDVTIDEGYNVSVKHRSGIEGIGTLSAGERQVLALSFMAALNGVSGFDVPIIIDTPLGRLSKEPKKNIAMNLPNYLIGKQVTLLVTEEEYTPEVREKLACRVGKEYLINFKESDEGNLAKVVPLGD